jgi:RNA polymerase sigma-70 factor (ECF subfamily)
MRIGQVQPNTSVKTSAVLASQASDEALIRAIAKGDKGAIGTLYVRHSARIARFIMRIVRNESSVDEIVNEVFLDVWRRADQFEGKSQVATWLMGIARYKAISEIRRHSEAPLDANVAATIEDPADSPATTMDKNDRSAILHKCLAKLSPQHREVINLIYYQEKKIEEVARFLGAPVNTIKTRMFYARSRMAELLAEVGVDRAWVAI